MASDTLPRQIRSRLAAVRRSLRTVDVGLGLARAVIAAALALVLVFSLDTLLEPPLGVIRTFALFTAMVAGAVATLFLARPLRRPLTDDDVALLVEREFPELEDGLVSTVQLSREADRPDLYTSRALIVSTVERTARKVEKLDFGRVVRFGPLVPLWVLTLASLALIGLLGVHPATAAYARTFFDRVVLGHEVGYPKLVAIEVQLAQEVAVAKGDDLVVDVHVTRGAERVQRLLVRTRYPGQGDEERDLLKVGEGLYRKTYQNVTEPFEFFVEESGSDVASQIHRVRVVQRPRVEQYDFVLDYPDYTGKPTEAVSQPDLQVPVGTWISYVVVANKPIAKAQLLFDEGARPRARPEADGEDALGQGQLKAGPAPELLGAVGAQALADEWAELAPLLRRRGLVQSGGGLDPEQAARTLVGKFQVLKDVRFHYQLLSTEGYETGKRPVVFSATAQRDRAPQVSIPVPGRRKQVTPQARLPIEVEARDEYGLNTVELRLRAASPQDSGPRPDVELPLPEFEEGAREVRLKVILDVADQRLQPGDKLEYFAVASDFNIEEDRRAQSSRTFDVLVVRPEDLERILQDRLSVLKERLEAAAREQREAKKGAEEFVAEVRPKDVLTEEDRRRLQRLGYEQRRITTRLEEIKKELADIEQERQLNRLDDEAAMELVRELLAGATELADRASPQVFRELEDARTTPQLDEALRNRLARVPDLQEDLARAILALAARIDKWGDFTEVIREVRDLLGQQEQIIDGTGRAVRAGQGGGR